MNILFDKFPDTVCVNGEAYQIETDFREWIRFVKLVEDEDIPWQEAAFALQRKSERKRALDTLLDAAAQDFAAHKDEIEHFIEEGPRGDIVEKATQQREERRKRLAQAAVREHQRRQNEIGRMMSREKKER